MIDPRRAIATRVYRTDTGDEVVATIFAPEDRGDGEWECPFRIVGLGQEIEERARGGSDGIDALRLAMAGLRYFLERSGKVLTWPLAPCPDPEPGDLGLPRTIPTGFGRPIEQELEQILDDATTRLIAEHKRSGRGPTGA